MLRIRQLGATCLLLLLFSAVACGGDGSVPVERIVTLRAHQDRDVEPRRLGRAVQTPPAAQSAVAPTAAITAAEVALIMAAFTTEARHSGPTDRLVSADRTLNVSVGIYSDCSGKSPIETVRADLDPCFLGRFYFVGHSPGVFSPLLHMTRGSIIIWYDGSGISHPLRIVSLRDVRTNSQPLFVVQPEVVAQFQTCLTPDGSWDRILDAVEA